MDTGRLITSISSDRKIQFSLPLRKKAKTGKMKHFRIYILLAIIPFLIAACSYSDKSDGGGDISGQGGSTARFTIKGDYLYTVDQSSLHTLSLADIEHPQKVSDKPLGFYTETIYPYENSLLLGTQTGMFVFSLNDPANPSQTTFFQHIRSCDPVVAQNGFAYITLNNSNQRCNTGMNELQILDINNLSTPVLVKTINMAAPRGLDINNDTLVVCDQGLRVFDVSNKSFPYELTYYPGIQAQDVIYQQGRLIVTSVEGIFQFRQTPVGLQILSIIPIQL
jgi:hypothetical protein